MADTGRNIHAPTTPPPHTHPCPQPPPPQSHLPSATVIIRSMNMLV